MAKPDESISEVERLYDNIPSGITARISPERLCRACGINGAHEMTAGGRILLASPFCLTCSEQMNAEAEAEEHARLIARLTDPAVNGLSDEVADWTADSYPRDRDGKAAVRIASEWLIEYRSGVRRNLYVHGNVGAGKSGLAVAMVKRLAEEGTSAFFVNWRGLLADLKRSFNMPDEPPPSAVVRAHTFAVLALDDLGAERPTEWAMEELAELVQRRRDSRLPVIVTSNYSPEALLRYFGEDVAAGRILDRLLDDAIVHAIGGTSRRRSIFRRSA